MLRFDMVGKAANTVQYDVVGDRGERIGRIEVTHVLDGWRWSCNDAPVPSGTVTKSEAEASGARMPFQETNKWSILDECWHRAHTYTVVRTTDGAEHRFSVEEDEPWKKLLTRNSKTPNPFVAPAADDVRLEKYVVDALFHGLPVRTHPLKIVS